jgi:hypothetical protein
MSAFPCLRCDQPYTGSAFNVYMTLFDGDLKVSFRYIVCPACRDDLAEEWIKRSMYRNGSDQWELPKDDRKLEDLWVLPRSNGSRR